MTQNYLISRFITAVAAGFLGEYKMIESIPGSLVQRLELTHTVSRGILSKYR